MKVINLFGGPCTGKSTIAAGLFHEMKMDGCNVELVTEYAKDMTWEERDNILNDQLYILAKQHRRLSRLVNKVDYVVTDSPLLLGLVYVADDYFKSYKNLVFEMFNTFDNYNFLLTRPSSYSEVGRNQTYEEALLVDHKIYNILVNNNNDFIKLPISMSDISNIILSDVENRSNVKYN